MVVEKGRSPRSPRADLREFQIYLPESVALQGKWWDRLKECTEWQLPTYAFPCWHVRVHLDFSEPRNAWHFLDVVRELAKSLSAAQEPLRVRSWDNTVELFPCGATKSFHISDVLSVTTGYLVSLRHIDGVSEVLDFMSGESLMTHALPRAMDEIGPVILEQHPELANVDASGITAENQGSRVAEWEAAFGSMVLLEAAPERERKVNTSEPTRLPMMTLRRIRHMGNPAVLHLSSPYGRWVESFETCEEALSRVEQILRAGGEGPQGFFEFRHAFQSPTPIDWQEALAEWKQKNDQ